MTVASSKFSQLDANKGKPHGPGERTVEFAGSTALLNLRIKVQQKNK